MLATTGELAVFAAPSETYGPNGAPENTKNVQEFAKALEKKYGIGIKYPTTETENESIPAIFPQTLETLDAALSTVTPEIVNQVSSYYYSKNSRLLTFAYTSSDLRGPYSFSPNPDVMVGCFDQNTSRIDLYIPLHEGQAIATGDNPLTILHEFAHAVQLMLIDKMGYSRMEREWNELMGGNLYAQVPADPKIFITEYASLGFEEDFAETFSYVYMSDRPGLGFSHRIYSDEEDVSPNDILTPLGEKVAYIEALIARYTTENGESLKNYRKIYTTPSSIKTLGIRLSGPHLLFIGMSEPRTVPLMLLNNLDVVESETVWIPDIGGWHCQDSLGTPLILFPNGTYGKPGKNILEKFLQQQETALEPDT